jgi:hypothetical protein
MKTQVITSTVVPEHQRLDFMPSLFTRQCFVVGERMLFGVARRISQDYQGGLWTFVRLSNGAGYAYPVVPSQFNVFVSGNGYEGELSADAFGILCTLMALSETTMFAYMREMTAANEALADHFHLLGDFAAQHAEASKIFRAKD